MSHRAGEEDPTPTKPESSHVAANKKQEPNPALHFLSVLGPSILCFFLIPPERQVTMIHSRRVATPELRGESTVPRPSFMVIFCHAFGIVFSSSNIYIYTLSSTVNCVIVLYYDPELGWIPHIKN